MPTETSSHVDDKVRQRLLRALKRRLNALERRAKRRGRQRRDCKATRLLAALLARRERPLKR